MTPEQTKRRIAVMAKHGEPGWRIECLYNEKVWRVIENPAWDYGSTYRAVRVETTAGKRVPLPWETLRCGMVVRCDGYKTCEMLVIQMSQNSAYIGRGALINSESYTKMEHLDGSTWKPLWTEEPGGERIVEIISEEGV